MKNFIICCLLIFQALTGAYAQSLRQQADQLLRTYQQQGQFDGALIVLCNTDAGDLEAIAKQLLALVVPGKS